MNNELVIQEQGHRTWRIVRLFYESLIEFRRQYDRYEEKVIALARETGIHRDVLRLRAAELAGLLDFKSLEALRDGCILELKDLCHQAFRYRDHTDPLDRYVADIFHEISILKEEHYTVKTYAPLYEEAAAKVELQYILDEAHAMFPQKLKQVRYLFGRAQERMEQHLASFAASPIFIRSLYLHRDRFIAKAYPDGLRAFYRRMYPCGPFEGFYQVGLSFYHSGFFPQALEAFSFAMEEYEDALAASRRLSGASGNGARADNGSASGSIASATTRRARKDVERRLPVPPSAEVVRTIMASMRQKIRRLTQPGAPAAAVSERAAAILDAGS